MVKIIKMSTEIKERLYVYDEKSEPMYFIFLNDLGDMMFTNDLDSEDNFSAYMTITKEDWQEIKKFIDKQFLEQT
jgi:hypothetical protein